MDNTLKIINLIFIQRLEVSVGTDISYSYIHLCTMVYVTYIVEFCKQLLLSQWTIKGVRRIVILSLLIMLI